MWPSKFKLSLNPSLLSATPEQSKWVPKWSPQSGGLNNSRTMQWFSSIYGWIDCMNIKQADIYCPCRDRMVRIVTRVFRSQPKGAAMYPTLLTCRDQRSKMPLYGLLTWIWICLMSPWITVPAKWTNSISNTNYNYLDIMSKNNMLIIKQFRMIICNIIWHYMILLYCIITITI